MECYSFIHEYYELNQKQDLTFILFGFFLRFLIFLSFRFLCGCRFLFSNRRFFLGLAPAALLPLDPSQDPLPEGPPRVIAAGEFGLDFAFEFDEPGTYLVVCNLNPHFLFPHAGVRMFQFITGIGDDDDDDDD